MQAVGPPGSREPSQKFYILKIRIEEITFNIFSFVHLWTCGGATERYLPISVRNCLQEGNQILKIELLTDTHNHNNFIQGKRNICFFIFARTRHFYRTQNLWYSVINVVSIQ